MIKEVLSFGSRTDTGLVREHNEDSLVARPPLFAVADGMGGHEAGEVASEIAIETLTANTPAEPSATELGNAVIAANHAVIAAALEGVGKPGMGTTVTAAMVKGTKLVVAQVGDSRAYLLHEGSLQRITRDHSYVADLIEQGEITEEEARWHPQRSDITRALGGDENMVPDLYELTVGEGDRILLCSDGLTGMVLDERIEEILVNTPDPQEATDALVNEALQEGGHDNVTVIVINPSGQDQLVVEKAVKRSKASLIAFVIAFVIAIGAAVGGVYAYARSSAYLVAENEMVAVYRGLVGDIAGVHLSWYDHTTDVRVSDLPENIQERLDNGITFQSLDKANEAVDSYKADIAAAKAPGNGTPAPGPASGGAPDQGQPAQ